MKQLKLIQLIRTVYISMVKRPRFFVLITREVDITRAHVRVDPFSGATIRTYQYLVPITRITNQCILHTCCYCCVFDEFGLAGI